MGVSVRQKDGNWYTFTRVNGERVAQKFKSQEEAEDVAKAIRNAIALGQFDIAALKKKRVEAEEERPPVTLKEYYEKTVQPLWEGSLSRNTYLSYDGSFRVHILPALGCHPLSEVSRDRIKRFVAELRKKPVTTSTKKTESEEKTPAEPRRLLSKESIRNIIAAL